MTFYTTELEEQDTIIANIDYYKAMIDVTTGQHKKDYVIRLKEEQNKLRTFNT